MKRIFLLLAAVCLVSCKQGKTETPGAQPFFLFDKVIHYHKDISQAEMDSLDSKPDKSRMDLGLMQIVTGNVPTSPRDTLFVQNMDILKFSKKELDASLNMKLSEIFSQKETKGTNSETNCRPIYKDVLVFRQKGKVVGVAKISFDCKKQQMVGIRYTPKDFGKAGEYEELQKVLSAN
ncbi:hypothetical protein HUK80_05130 [Flavobacterium sp. MAH-1]|uniref:Uncharacterized protein n=1 Tax=Flavobacterium agri TaxID=2743471 RepID=A0A7Y8Y0R9_9FLAO|nr:hypothetical protein [Flavobacterium agri]NUY80271.1 hypothetical protein [Flavobacterium agri]NYA70296.1 hypothetical protein [Flavobacterium agri]